MAIRQSQPFRFQAVGCSDTRDLTEVFPGAMSQLSNLIADPTTKNLWVARPAAVKLIDLAPGVAGNVGFVSSLLIVGDYAYGTVAMTSGALLGYDVPYCVNLKTKINYIITGFDASNCPTSPTTSGNWVPPILDVVGTKVIITHPGFPNGANKIGVIDISNQAAPAYAGADLATNAFVTTPSAVKNFNGRAYYLCNGSQPAVVFSDILAPTTRTNANQVLTFDDNVSLNALGTLQFLNQLGGIVQALIVFKGGGNMFQITGDYTASTLSKNAMNVAVGTFSPLSICNTPNGMKFLAPDGFRLMDQNAVISDPIGTDGQGITVPFIYAKNPSRVVAASNAEIIRVSTQNDFVPGSPWQEWWYDLSRNAWSGPHTFPASQIASYMGTFIMAPVGVLGSLWQSDSYQASGSTFVENGTQMTFKYQTPNVPDLGDDMNEYTVTEAYIYLAFDSIGNNVVITAQNQQGNALDTVVLQNPSAGGTWGTMVWGRDQWGGYPNALSPISVKWNQPLVFSRASFAITGNCSLGTDLGGFWLRLGHTGYIKQVQ